MNIIISYIRKLTNSLSGLFIHIAEITHTRPLWPSLKFIKFCFVGLLNTLLDLAILNTLIYLYKPLALVPLFIFAKSFSTGIAIIHSYYWNSQWVFQKKIRGKSSIVDRKHFYTFFIITSISSVLYVLCATLIQSYILKNFLEISATFGANVSTFIATAVSVSINFISYKLFVFQDKSTDEDERGESNEKA